MKRRSADRLPLNALRAFALVLERGGVRAAARELGVSHSAVSRHLTELEQWLGVGLLEKRGGRGLTVTAQGRRFGTRAQAALRELRRAVEAVREQRTRRTVVLSTTPSFAVRWLLPRLPALQRAHPRLEVSVITDQRLHEPEDFPADVAIRMGRGPWPGLGAEPLMQERLYPVMSPGLWRQAGRPSEPAGLSGLALLHDRDPEGGWPLWRERFGPPALDVRAGARFASSDLVLRAAAHGLGVALGRDRFVREDLATGALLRPFGERAVDLGSVYWIVTPAQSAPGGAVGTLIAWLKRAAARPELIEPPR